MTYSPTRFSGRSCSSSGQQLQQRPPRRTSQPGRAEAPAAAAAAAAGAGDVGDEGVAGSAAADVAADVAVEVAGGHSSPDTGNQSKG